MNTSTNSVSKLYSNTGKNNTINSVIKLELKSKIYEIIE